MVLELVAEAIEFSLHLLTPVSLSLHPLPHPPHLLTPVTLSLSTSFPILLSHLLGRTQGEPDDYSCHPHLVGVSHCLIIH